jgi:hypothetical protein
MSHNGARKDREQQDCRTLRHCWRLPRHRSSLVKNGSCIFRRTIAAQRAQEGGETDCRARGHTGLGDSAAEDGTEPNAGGSKNFMVL